MSRNNKVRRNRRRKTGLIISVVVAVLAVICVLIGVGYKRLFNNPKNIDTSEIATYEYEETTSDFFGALMGGLLQGGEATRHKVTVIEEPGVAGETIQSTYVSDGGSIELKITKINTGYLFEGWYEDGEKLSGDQNYTLSNITKDRTIIAKFSPEYITVTTNAIEFTGGADDFTQKGATFRSLGSGLTPPGGTYQLTDDGSNKYKIFGYDAGSEYRLVGYRIELADGTIYHLEGSNIFHLCPRRGSTDLDKANRILNLGSNVTISAVYQRKTFAVTLAMMPDAGKVQIDGDDGGPGVTYSPRYTTHTRMYNNTEAHTIYLNSWIPEDTVQVYDTDSKEYKYVNRYEIDDIYKVEKDGTLTSVGLNHESSFPRSYWGIYHVDAGNTEDLSFLVKLKATQATDVAGSGVVGVPVPANGGTISGGGSSTIASNYQLKATPNDGYEFVRWEWEEAGVEKINYDNPLTIFASEFIYCKAYFAPKAYKVSLSSLSPAGSAQIEGLGGYRVDEQTGVANANINIIPLPGYELDTISYTMNGANYDPGVPSLADGKYKVNISNIKGDVALNIKMKKTSGIRVTATVDVEDPAASLDNNYVSISSPTSQSAEKTSSTVLTVHHDMTSPTDSVKLTATPDTDAGYCVKQWVDSRGNVYVNPDKTAAYTITVNASSLTDDITYTAQFEKTTFPITVKVDDTTNATAKILDASNNTQIDTAGTANVEGGSDIKLIATAQDGYLVKYWTNGSGARMTGEQLDGTNSNVLVLRNVNWSETYTAHIVSASINITIVPRPDGSGTVQLNDNSAVEVSTTYNNLENGADITLKANPANGYKFVRWETRPADGSGTSTAYAEPFISILNVTQDLICTALFSERTYTIKANPSPTEAGSTTVNGKTGEAVFALGDTAVLEATSNNSLGYRFDYWTDSAGNRYNDNPHEIIVDADDTYTAHFVKGIINVTVAASPVDGGLLKVNGNDFISGSKVPVSSGENVTLTAEPINGYKFVRWESMGESGQQPVAYADREIHILNISQSETYTAVFSKELYTIKVVSSPIAGGTTTASGRINEASYAPGEQATLQATPAAGYTFDYWTDSAGNRYTDNPYVIESVQGNDTFTAHYIEGELEIVLNVMPDGAGSLKFNGTAVSPGAANQVVSGSNVTLTAEVIDSSKYVFERWESSEGKVYTSNPLQLVNVTESETYTAVFNLLTGKTGILVIASPPSGGQALKTISKDGKSAILKAIPRPGYSFVEWRKDGVVVSKTPIFTTFDLTDGTTYVAVFVKTHDVDVRSDIIREHFYNDKRIFTAPNYAVTRQKLENDAKITIEADRSSLYKDSTPGLKNYKTVNDAKEIFDDIELKDDMSAVMLDSELVTTDGEIMPLTVVEDRAKEESLVKEFTEKKYGKHYTYEIIACKDVGIPEGFVDGIRTYIWKYQEVHNRDNIYILYEPKDGGKTDWVSCTIDAGDSLKFTIDSVGSGVRMTIVKVIIE